VVLLGSHMENLLFRMLLDLLFRLTFWRLDVVRMRSNNSRATSLAKVEEFRVSASAWRYDGDDGKGWVVTGSERFSHYSFMLLLVLSQTLWERGSRVCRIPRLYETRNEASTQKIRCTHLLVAWLLPVIWEVMYRSSVFVAAAASTFSILLRLVMVLRPSVKGVGWYR